MFSILAKTGYFIIVLIATVVLTNSLQVIPERANVTYLNKKFLDYGNVTVTRYSRKSGYFLNVEVRNKHVWANNVSLHLYFFEFLHNEYRRSFVEIHLKFCDMLKGDPYIGGLIPRVNLTCPVLPRHYSFMNMTVPADDFPNVWPFEKAKVEGNLVTNTREVICTGYIFLRFAKNNPKVKSTTSLPTVKSGQSQAVV